MYYSKGGASQINIPRNYAGNVIFADENFVSKPSEDNIREQENAITNDEISIKNENFDDERSTKINKSSPALSSLLSDISVEDLLLLGLILVVYQSDPQDPTLIILLILLLVK